MITRIEALNYRCLRYVAQDLDAFHVLVGPNASGKSTFLDVFRLMSDLIAIGPDGAVSERVPDFQDLVWMRQPDHFEVAVEVRIPEDRREHFKNGGYERARYEVSLGVLDADEPPKILAETFWLLPSESKAPSVPRSRHLFPELAPAPQTILHGGGRKAPSGWRKIVTKVADSGNDYFSSETSNWNNLFRLGPQKSALANLPEDETKFPVATWFKELLMVGIDRIALNSEQMRQPSPPRAPRFFLPDGSTLPWVIDRLASRQPDRFKDWIDHVRSGLPELKMVESIERPEDRHRYLVLEFQNDLKVPSWGASDGTLRLLALTLLAYLSETSEVFLVEEPENGIHPRAVETVFQSLSSVYDAQVFLATHSPVILSIAKLDQVLCFAKTEEGAADIVRGPDHPGLRHWKGGVDLGTLFASGVLGATPVHVD